MVEHSLASKAPSGTLAAEVTIGALPEFILPVVGAGWRRHKKGQSHSMDKEPGQGRGCNEHGRDEEW